MDKRNAAKAGKVIEFLGSYNARQKTANFKEDRIKYWLSVGAKASASVHNLLVSKNIVQGAKIDVSAKPKKKEGVEVNKEKGKTEEKDQPETEKKNEEALSDAGIEEKA